MTLPIPQPRIPGAPATNRKGRATSFVRWLKRILLGLLALTLLLYLSGRLWEPARSLLVRAPGIGGAFSSPVWQLPDWLSPAPKSPTPTQPPAQTGTADLSGLSAQLSAQQAQLSLSQQALEQKEREQRVVEERLAERLKEVEGREQRLERLEANLSQVEVLRAMKPAAVTAIFTNLPDTEALGVLRYMENEEVAKILGSLDSERAATLFRELGALKQRPATGS